MVVPLQFGIPGGPELLVILLMMLLFFGVPLALVVGGVVLYRNRSREGDRVEELEARIDDLERELDRERRADREDTVDRDGGRESP
jgi:sec-independent protein translocase protein TatA